MKITEKTQNKSKKYVAIAIAVTVVAIAIVIFSTNLPNSNLVIPGNAEGLQVGNVAPDFSLTDPQKGIITKQNFHEKPLFIFFTATWCTPCQIGAQNLAKYDTKTGNNAFNVLIVFVDEKESDSQFIQWRQKFGNDDWYVAKGLEIAKTYNVKFLDTKYVFDKNGIIQWVDYKPLDYSSIDPVLKPLLET